MYRKDRWLYGALFFGTLVFLLLDIRQDLAQGSGWKHIAEEMAVFSFAIFGLLFLGWRHWQTRVSYRAMEQEVSRTRRDFENYKRETAYLTQGLGQKIQDQFRAWELTSAEKEVCQLLLKGLSTKEIASVRSTSEKTITQQLSSVYQKSGLKGRSELLAFFLEDLF